MSSNPIWFNPNDTKKPLIESLSYWKQTLNSPPPPLKLPFHRAKERCSNGNIDRIPLSLTDSIYQELKHLTDQLHASFNTLLLSTFYILLYRYTNQSRIIIGFAAAKRSTFYDGAVIENNLDMLPLRVEIAPSTSFSELVYNVRQIISEGYLHGVPLTYLMEALTQEERKSLAEHFNIAFSFTSSTNPELPSNSFSDILWGEGFTGFSTIELALSIKDTTTDCLCDFVYDSDLFEAGTIKRVAEDFRLLIKTIVDKPGKSISALQSTSETKISKIRAAINTNVARQLQHSVVSLFEQEVERSADNLAVVYKDKMLTYRSLNNFSNQVAYFLQSKGVKREALIPICVEQSLDMVVWILGILKAGCAYIPVNPYDPVERINYILDDTSSSLFVTDHKDFVNAEKKGLDVLSMEKEWEAINSYPTDDLQKDIRPGDLAYVIYTSGSTGTPKGVMIEHGSLLNYLINNKADYITDKKENSGSFVHLSYTFDASITALFMPLLFGKSIVIGSKRNFEVFQDDNLWKYAPYDFIKITPAHLALLNDTIEERRDQWLTNKLVIGGEALHYNYFSKFRAKKLNVEIINEYGPTEATVGCSTYHFNTGDDDEKLVNGVPIGKAIDNVDLFILSDSNELAPIGVSGEICIGGKGLARGYLNRPALTDQKFIKQPFSAQAGSRIYKTGDLGRWLEDGNIEYLGRIDDQVKVNGYRIELGEIENVLLQSGLVTQGVVLVKEDDAAVKRLVGYVVPNGRFDKKAVIQYLTDKLAHYMVPMIWVVLEALPLTTNGKIDKKVLPSPDFNRQVNTKYEPPHNKLEIKLANIWKEVLKVKRVGIADDFFELGGTSINAVRLFSRIRKTFNKDLSIATLLKASTIEELAKHIRDEQSLLLNSSLVPLQPKGLKPPLYLVHGGGGHILLYAELVKCLDGKQPVFALQARGLNGNEVPHQCIEDMAADYVRDIRTIQPNGPYQLGGYCFGAIVAFEMAQQLTKAGAEVSFLASFNGISPNYVEHADQKKDRIPNGMAAQLTKKESFHLDSSVKKWGKQRISEPVRKYLSKYKLKTALLRIRTQNLAYKFYLSRNKPLPKLLAKDYYLNTNSNMADSYVPKRYEGHMVIFRSPELYDDPSLGWSRYVTDIKTIDIPGKHRDRRSILEEPFVEYLANDINKML
jgi:amino acid adenylation domain-containing protein